MRRTYTFNRPITLLFSLPLLLLLVMLFYGIFREFNFLVLFLLLVTLLFYLPVIYLGFFRRLRVESQQASWITPRSRHTIALDEVRHYGIIKYRAFRFIYLSRAESAPFKDPEARLVANPDTFLIQYRPGAWQVIEGLLRELHPQLSPDNFQRR